MDFPDSKRFAFTILDDTDDSTLENIKPIYSRLRNLGFRTTKTVWPMACPEGSQDYFAADTLQRPDYLAFVKELVDAGFELASHGATMESSERERTRRGLEFVEQEFGFVPRLHVNHGQNHENLYWGANRFQSPGVRSIVGGLGRHPAGRFAGERPESPYYWGDLFERHFEYLRNFTIDSLDMFRFNPEMPYRLASTPCVRGWFSTSDAPDAEAFKRLVTADAIDQLERSRGVCIVSTHLGKGFTRDGRMDPQIDAVLSHIASRPGWFVPVSTLLDYLREHGGGQQLGGVRLLRLELRFLVARLRARLRHSAKFN
jgi:hypothetical protein